MTGILKDGGTAEKVRDRRTEDRREMAPEQARDLRRLLHGLLKKGGYSTVQIGQIMGWKGRTIRRDLADLEQAINARRRGHAGAAEAEGTAERPARGTGPGNGGAATRLSAEEIRELIEEYGPDSPFANNGETRAFLDYLRGQSDEDQAEEDGSEVEVEVEVEVEDDVEDDVEDEVEASAA